MSSPNELGDFGFSSDSDVEVCRGCAFARGHAPDCAFRGHSCEPDTPATGQGESE